MVEENTLRTMFIVSTFKKLAIFLERKTATRAKKGNK